MTLPNSITLMRVLLGPLFLIFYIYPHLFGLSQTKLPIALLILIVISEISDALDGFLARKYHQITDFGKLLDPMADSVTRLSMFLAFTKAPINLPVEMVLIFIYRDSIISTLRTICALKGFALAARTSGKIKTALQGLAALVVVFLMLFQAHGFLSEEMLQTYSFWILGSMASYTLFSLFDYIYAHRHYIQASLNS